MTGSKTNADGRTDGRRLCPNCLRHIKTCQSGKLRKHVVNQYEGLLDGEPNWCNGSGWVPEEFVKTHRPARDYAWFKNLRLR